MRTNVDLSKKQPSFSLIFLLKFFMTPIIQEKRTAIQLQASATGAMC